METFQKAALFYVLTLIVFFYGYAVARFEVPPHAFLESRVQEIQAFTAGDALDKDTSIVEKIQSDAGLVPRRFFGGIPKGLYRESLEHTPLPVPGLNSRREQPQIYIDDKQRGGYRLIYGAIDFEDSFWGAILIDSRGEVIHSWHMSTEHLPENRAPDHRKILYGTHVGRDGSIIFSMQEPAGGIVKIDACSNEVWTLPGRYHHTVSADGAGAFWTFTGAQGTFDQDMAKVSVKDGQILQTINMAEVRQKNDDVNIWNLIDPLHANWKDLSNSGHMTHGNDIDPLKEDYADTFSRFDVGDLLISYASTNLVFVLDPDTLKVKWWRVGVVDYQHDPDWEADGRISIFNNNNRHFTYNKQHAIKKVTKHSNIVSIDPDTYESEVIFSGESTQFHSIYNGRHQRTEYDTRIITSSNQGWVLEVDNAGEIVFSFLNIYKNMTTLFLSNALRLPEEYFDGKPWEACQPRS